MSGSTGWRRVFRLAVVAAMVLGLALAVGAPASASTPWGACGNSTPESKEVTRYAASARFYYYLRCGNANGGYRHILARHRADFENMAFGTYQNWRDIADLSMDVITRDYDEAQPAGDGKACLSRVIFLRNIRTNQPVRQQIVRMYVVIASNNIITVYPASTQCPKP